jgi:hypothetical protein
MLRSGYMSIRTPLSGPARPHRPTSLHLPIYLSKYLSFPCSLISRGYVCVRCLAAAIFPIVHPISRRTAPPSSVALPSHARPALSATHAGVLLRCRRRRSPPEGRGRCWRRGRRDTRPQQGDVAMKAHVASVCFKYFRRFWGILQLFHMNVAKVDQRCYACCKVFQRHVLQVFQRRYSNILFVSDVCCVPI